MSPTALIDGPIEDGVVLTPVMNRYQNGMVRTTSSTRAV